MRSATEPPKRVVLYARVSSERQARDSTSVDDQLAALREWAERAGHEVVGTFRDDGISASRFARKTRPEWQQAMDQISTGRVDVLAVWALPRASRDRMAYAALIAACIDNGTRIALDGRLFDPADPDDGLTLDVQNMLAVNGAARISKDAKRAAASRASRGAPHGRPIDGLRIIYDPTTGKAQRRELDPVRAPIVREIAERILAGESAYSVARDLNGREIKSSSGKPWRGQNIVKRISSPSLAGLVEHDGRLVDAEWPGVITPDQYHRIVALLAQPDRKKHRSGVRIRYLLSGIARCGVCSAPMYTIPKRRADGTSDPRYACSGPHVCTSRRVEPLDELVEGAVIRFLSRPDVAAELADGDADAERKAASERAAELNAMLIKARKMVKERRLSLDSLADLEEWAVPERDECERRARPPFVPTVVYDVIGPEAAARWKATDVRARREIVRALFTVTVNKSLPRNQRTGFDAATIDVERRRR